jgi:outer membrane protein assembly factor BamB
VLPGTVTIPQLGSQQLVVNVFDANGALVTGVSVSFESNDPDMISVTRSGLVTADGSAGSTAVTVRAGAASVQVPVTVTQVPGSITFTPSQLTIPQGQSAPVTITLRDMAGDPIAGASFLFQSSDPRIAVIENGNRVLPTGRAGHVTLTARVDDVTGTMEVTVTPVPVSISADPSTMTIGPGRSRQIVATLRDIVGDPVPGHSFTFESSDEAIITVTATGVAQSVGPLGSATVTVRSGELSTTVSITVAPIVGLEGVLAGRAPLAGSPYGLAVSANGLVLVGTLSGTIAKAQLPNFALAPLPVTGGMVQAIAFNSTGTVAWASGAPNDGLTAIDVASGTAIGSVLPLDGTPIDVIVSPDDQRVYQSTATGKVYIIDAGTRDILHTVSVGSQVVHLAVHPTQPRVYASVTEEARVVEIDAATGQIRRPFAVNGRPQKLLVSADGLDLFVAIEGGTSGVERWDLLSGTRELSVSTCGPFGMAATPDGTILFAGCQGGSILQIDAATLTLQKTFELGGLPRRMAMSPDGSTLIIANEVGVVDFVQ